MFDIGIPLLAAIASPIARSSWSALEALLAQVGVESPDMDSIAVVYEYPAMPAAQMDPYGRGVFGRLVDPSGSHYRVSAAQLNGFSGPEIFPLPDQNWFWSPALYAVCAYGTGGES